MVAIIIVNAQPDSKILRSWLISEILHRYGTVTIVHVHYSDSVMVTIYFSPKQHKMVIVIDESKLRGTEFKAESSGMLLAYEEDDYDSGVELHSR